jgi:small GTP-binding protein
MVECGQTRVKLQFWDTAGQERFKAITSTYFKGAGAIILVFDLTDRDSFDRIPSLYEEIALRVDTSRVNFLLVGNKSDLSF